MIAVAIIGFAFLVACGVVMHAGWKYRISQPDADGWYHCAHKPNRAGWYERQYANDEKRFISNYIDYWDGKCWLYDSPLGRLCVYRRRWRFERPPKAEVKPIRAWNGFE